MSGIQKTWPLFPADAPSPASVRGEEACSGQAVSFDVRHDRLWLCLYFPWLPLEAVGEADSDTPRAIVTGHGQRTLVLLANEAAARAGVQPGMTGSAALALSAELVTQFRDPEREQQLLLDLVPGALRFTPWVSIESRSALLLEIASSQQLLGGMDAVRAVAVAWLRSCGHQVMTGLAPTARAALWLAKAGSSEPVTDLASLPAALSGLPVGSLGWPPALQEALRRMGVMRFGDCLRLPRGGLARRLGRTCLREIDEALGRRPELRQACRQDEQFSAHLALPSEASGSSAILDALGLLLGRLGRHLHARQQGVQVLWIKLHQRLAPAALLRIGLVQPGNDMARLQELAALRLGDARLNAPVTAVTLEAGPGIPLVRAADWGLVGIGAGSQSRQITDLVDSLRMRLGIQAVHGVWPDEGHRPERAWQVIRDPGAGYLPSCSAASGAGRPLWLLEQPVQLDERSGMPCLHGPMTLERGPERIETGWWDGQDVRRDYYVGRSRRGTRAWVFLDRRSGRWYLHGLFG